MKKKKKERQKRDFITCEENSLQWFELSLFVSPGRHNVLYKYTWLNVLGLGGICLEVLILLTILVLNMSHTLSPPFLLCSGSAPPPSNHREWLVFDLEACSFKTQYYWGTGEWQNHCKVLLQAGVLNLGDMGELPRGCHVPWKCQQTSVDEWVRGFTASVTIWQVPYTLKTFGIPTLRHLDIR